MKIPNQQNLKWQQDNSGELFGNLNSSFNLDLSTDKGHIKASPRFMYTYSGVDDADFKVPWAIKRLKNSGDDKWFVGSDFVFVGGTEPDDAFTQDGATGTPNINNAGDTATPDMELFPLGSGVDLGLFLGLSGSNGLYYRALTTPYAWSQIATTCYGAPLLWFGDRLYYRYDSYTMSSTDIALTPVTPSGIPNTNDFCIRFLNGKRLVCGRANSQFIWLGLRTTNQTNAQIAKWNGVSENASAFYNIPAKSILSIWIGGDDQPYCIDSNLVIWGFNGGTFVRLDQFPMRVDKRIASPYGVPSSFCVHYNGTTVLPNGDVAILANPKYADGTFEPLAPAGVWIFNKENGLYHSGSMSLWKYGTTTTPNDYGQVNLSGVGALALALSDDSSVDGEIMVGASFGASVTTLGSKGALFISNKLDTHQKSTTFTTPWVFSNEIKDNYNKVIARFKEFSTTGDKLVMKYRTKKTDSLDFSITWTGANSVLTSTNITTNYAVGDEVTILTGAGAGFCAHIIGITLQGSDYNIEFDDTFAGFSGSGTARIEKWIKSGAYEYSNGQEDNHSFSVVFGTSTKIQLKVFAIITGDWHLHDFNLINSNNQPAK